MNDMTVAQCALRTADPVVNADPGVSGPWRIEVVDRYIVAETLGSDLTRARRQEAHNGAILE
jgi:hypothetical protein